MKDTIIESLDILLVDDNQLFMDSIKMLLKNDSEINIIYEAKSGKEALEIIKDNHINIVITDVNMPEMTGIELTKIIKQRYPLIKIMVLTILEGLSIVNEVIESEAEGYLLKDTGNLELGKAIKEIAGGGKYYSNEEISVKG